MMEFASRRRFLLSAGAAVLAPAFAELPAGAQSNPSPDRHPDAVLDRLIEGNRHFVAGTLTHPGRSPKDFRALAQSQKPIAAILGCADSRVPPEILFDQGVGDLFIIRVAGNYVSGAGASVKGSVEYAVAELNVSLVMVLGHSQCGAVKAAIQHLHDNDALPGAINDLVNTIKPAVLESKGKPGDPLENAIRSNVRRSVERLRTLDPVIAPALHSGKIKVAGAVYDLASGNVRLV
ncbi:carbonic anhydrase [Edaphobacter sp. 12200R-103]|uniref:carbonic anhydrase n=1 Tax=Edaphobacter sp. 12200R-103 TaxID=2703788 RepID=UPI00138C6713|nr:carbonic anhydrase [Edaphobacter sp. 12200R-103]QHS52904.1 carbonic anhydrase [Edaphobacter sp. 12200R-103]